MQLADTAAHTPVSGTPYLQRKSAPLGFIADVKRISGL